MLQFIYNLLILFYKYLTFLASFFNQKAKQRWVGVRCNKLIISELLETKAISNNWKLAWFHAASLGEFEQARPVLEKFKLRNPNFKILVTFFSPSGYEIRKKYELADFVLYLPFDLPTEMKNFVAAIEPSIVFWTKYDYWRNCLSELSKKKIPVYLFSAHFRENHPFFKWYGGSFRAILTNFRHLFVQDESSRLLLQSIDFQNVTVAGDTRFDRVATIVENIEEVDVVKRFKGNKKMLVIGSAWQEDINCVDLKTPLVINKNEEILIVIAPHEIHENQIENWKNEFNGIRYSEVNNSTDLAAYKVLIIDNIGLLSSIYQYADYAFIGGAFGKGLHNILEAATFGIPIFFGNKNFKKFKEATDLMKLSCAFSVESNNDFKRKFETQVVNSEAINIEIKRYIELNTGAANAILDEISKINYGLGYNY